MSDSKKIDAVLAEVDDAKRATLTRLLTGTAFVAPIVASFAMDGLTVSKAQAANPNGSGLPSDRRLKTGIARLATLPSGLGLYRFKYLWSPVEYVGVMAQEVAAIRPDTVVRGGDGYLRVNYARLGLRLQTWNEWTASH